MTDSKGWQKHSELEVTQLSVNHSGLITIPCGFATFFAGFVGLALEFFSALLVIGKEWWASSLKLQTSLLAVISKPW